MRLINPRYKAALAIAASLALAPSVAFASTEALEDAADLGKAAAAAEMADQNEVAGNLLALANEYADGKEDGSRAAKKAKATKAKAGASSKSAASVKADKQSKSAKKAKAAKAKRAAKESSAKTSAARKTRAAKTTDSEKAAKTAESSAERKVLAVDRDLISQIGTQEETGHTICCPSFSCAYADAVMDGTVHDHEYYTCSCCTWTDWGGGGSSNRCVGTDEELLREAYDQISAGKPTVIHVAGTSGEHWIALIGYKNVEDPDHLTLDNFVALDPWDGAKITASKRYALYGDGCEHISDRKVTLR